MKKGIRFATTPSEQTRTRIMATVGPKTLQYDTLRAMVEAGASWFRFNGAHIEDKPDEDGQFSYADARTMVGHIKNLRNELHRVIGIYFDLGGPKIRIQNVTAMTGSDANEESWLHPEPGATVSIRLYDKAEHLALKKALEEFEPSEKDRKKFWKNESRVRQFFKSRKPASDTYELMFGDEVKNFAEFSENGVINLKDGWCKLRIKSIEKTRLRCVVEYRDSKFRFVPHQGANPHLHMFPDIITGKDIGDINFALRVGADVISLSFVCLPDDARDLRDKIRNQRLDIDIDAEFTAKQSATFHRYLSKNHEIPIFAKIETAFAVDYDLAVRYARRRGRLQPDPAIHDPLIEIAEHFDGLMVARGDLAVEVEKYAVPDLQRRIIRVARLKNKPVIVATEMLESMKRGNASTRAEIGDINTAVHQGADILMLSGETASTDGKPEDAVREMRDAIRQAEKESETEEETIDALEGKREKELRRKFENDPEREDLAVSRLSQGAQLCLSARSLKSDAVIASAHTGEAVREISYYRPRQNIFAITDDILTAVRLLQHRGVYPIVMEQELERTVDEFVSIANEIHLRVGIPVPSKDKGKSTFRLPGLLRIEPSVKPVETAAEIPNSLHEFTLPVQPRPMPEVEKKYVLTEERYGRLKACLSADAARWQSIGQINVYFTDAQMILENAEASIRIRKETLAGRFDGETGTDTTRILLTLKGRSTARAYGFDERQELEFDVTREYPDPDDLNWLPEVCRRHVTENWWPLLQNDYAARDQVTYIKRAWMPNERLRFAMNNGFVLELDRSEFKTASDAIANVQYELETEFHGNDKTRRQLDEYIHDKFARLDIPIVTTYPPKQQRVYFYADLMDAKKSEKIQRKIEAADEETARAGHRPCDICRKVDEAEGEPPVRERLHVKPPPPPPSASVPLSPPQPLPQQKRKRPKR